MQKRIFIILIGLVAIGLISSSKLMAGKVELLSYHPSPFGSYSNLRLVPRDSIKNEERCRDESDLGFMYFDNGKNRVYKGIYVCLQFTETDFGFALMQGMIVSWDDEDEVKRKRKELLQMNSSIKAVDK